MKQLFYLALMVCSLNLFAQNSGSDNITVEGKSSVKLQPELIFFNINFSVTDSNYTKCSNLALLKIKQIKEKFINEGIDKNLISTRSYSTREIREHDYKTNKRVFKGYRSNIPIVIKTNTANAKNHLIFEIIKNNFNADFNMNFALSPEQTDLTKKKLIDLAVKDARSKANLIASSADIKLGKIENIHYGEPRIMRNTANNNFELMSSARMVNESDDGFSALNPADIEMQTNITIAWEILQ